MVKKFVALDSEVKPSQTPYNIKTLKSSENEPRSFGIADPCTNETSTKPTCSRNGKILISRPITIEEAIFQWFHVPKTPTIQSKKKCKQFEPYTTCVLNQRTPETLKEHAVLREKYLKIQTDAKQIVHDGQKESSNGASLIEMDSLLTGEEGYPKPKPASPACSVETYFVPSRRLLDLKRPRSGIFINETPRLQGTDDIPYETYNPRKLQQRLESENRQKYKLISDGERIYFPWMQEQDEGADINRNQTNDFNQDVFSFKPVIFPIPSDLEKTFKAAVVFGNKAITTQESNPRSTRPIEIACLYAAYVESFSKNPDYWDARTIDSIIQSGMTLIKNSLDRQYTNPSSDFDIIPELTEKEAAIEIKLHLTAALTEEPNILKALTLFFGKFHAGILCVENLYFLIWKRCLDSFYIFDPNGRDLDCKRNSSAGKSSLIRIHTIEHIVHLILNYSDVEGTADFSLYEINLTDFGKLSRPMQLQVLKPPKKLHAVVNRFYAIIPALSGLPVVSGGKASDDNASLMTSYLALVYSQIDPPREWTVEVIDDLIKFGKKYHSDFLCDNRLKKLNIADLPEVLLFGNYRVLLDRKAFVQSGHVVDCKSYRASQLTPALKEFFLNNSFGLLQVDSSTFGLWRGSDRLFVFDPFKRGPGGQAVTLSKSGMGCLQIHLNLNSLCRVMFVNAISIKTEGNFFLHAIQVKAVGTFTINRALKDSAAFGTLQIKYPFDCEATPGKGEEPEKLPPPDSLNCSIVQCLSELSVNPCERTCSELEFVQQQKKMAFRSKLARTHSISSIPEQSRIPEYDDVDVIDSTVGEFIQDLMDKIQRATEKPPKFCIEASKILLQSDRQNLEDLKMRLKRGEDFDNYCSTFQTKQTVIPQLNVEEELAQATNFEALPDGSWAIFGRLTDLYISSGSLKGILSTLNAAVLSSKYKISTWNSDVIDYALEESSVLEERFWSYNHTLDLIFRNQIPKIKIGKTTFAVKVTSSKTVESEKLKSSLESIGLRATRLFVICKGLSCLILKRYNLIYMFMGCSCDVVGFRSQAAGPICLLRFLELNALIRRIEQACGPCQKYVLVEIEVKNMTDSMPRKFVPRTDSQEEVLFGRELNDKERQKQRYKEKLKFLESEIRKESKRVEKFQKEKQSPRKKKAVKLTSVLSQQRSIFDSSDFLVDLEDEYEMYEESEKSIEFKHTPRDNPNAGIIQVHGQKIPPSKLLGYQLRDEDCLFKIQGSTALGNRFIDSADKIKTCFFASTIALLYAILRPLNHWDSVRIDKVIYVAQTIANATINFDSSSSERIIKNIDADEFEFEVRAYGYTPPGTFGGDLEYIMNKAVQSQRYILLQISNTTFTVYRDKYFHLFDPYFSMEVVNEEGEEDESHRSGTLCPEGITKHLEQNTASWILFVDLTSMLNYIDKRATSRDWKTEYKLHAVNVVSHKTAPKAKQLLNILTDGLDATCLKTQESDNLCTDPEEIEWLVIHPNLVSWSRLNRSNSVNRVRGSPMTKDKNFDIEIPGKLYSLWGSIHPLSGVFGESRGKQHLAINVVACCVASLYRVSDWNTKIIDSIVINGNDYYNESILTINRKDYEISLEHLNTVFHMGHLQFEVHLESVIYGYLYSKAKNELNLAAALGYFFSQNLYGIVQCMKHSLAIGKIDSGYFMFECQSHGLPLFPSGEGAAYVLRTSQLQVLLRCIVMTLNNSFYNSQFTIHKVEVLKDKPEDQQGDQGEEEF